MKITTSTLIQSSILGMLLTFLSTAGAVPASCLKPKPNECGFYRECLEEKYHCGDSGYPLAYGEKYCHRFNSLNESNLSPEGLKWRDATLVCLQEDLVGRLLSPSYVANCDQLKQVAYNSHPRCYTQKGNSICDLRADDWKTISKVVDKDDKYTKGGIQQILQVVFTCGADSYKKYRELIGQRNMVEAQLLYSAMNTSTGEGVIAPMSEDPRLKAIDEEIRETVKKINFIERHGYNL